VDAAIAASVVAPNSRLVCFLFICCFSLERALIYIPRGLGNSEVTNM